MSERVAIIEPNGDGHRFYYAALIARQALNQGFHVELHTTGVWADSDEFRTHIAGICGVKVHAHESPRQCLRAGSTAHLKIVPDADTWLTLLARQDMGRMLVRRDRPELRLLLMRYYGVSGLRSRFRRMGKTLGVVVLRTLDSRHLVLALQPTFDTNSHQGGLLQPLRDPLPNAQKWCRRHAREEVCLARSLPLVTMAGKLDARKRVDLAIEAMARSPLLAGATMVLAGRLQPELWRQLEVSIWRQQLTLEGRLRIVDEYLTDSMLDAYIAAADRVLLAYANDASSGILARCVVQSTPVAAVGMGYVVDAVREFGLGTAIDTDIDIVEAIAKAISAPIGQRDIDGRFAALMDEASEAQFSLRLLTRL